MLLTLLLLFRINPHFSKDNALESKIWNLNLISFFSLKPPIVPKVSHEGDTSNFDVYPEDDWKKDPPVPQKDLEIFKNF